MIQKIKIQELSNPYENSVANLGKSQCFAMLILYLNDRDALTLLSISTALYSACFGQNGPEALTKGTLFSWGFRKSCSDEANANVLSKYYGLSTHILPKILVSIPQNRDI